MSKEVADAAVDQVTSEDVNQPESKPVDTKPVFTPEQQAHIDKLLEGVIAKERQQLE